MKRIIVLLLALGLICSLCACGNDISLNTQENDMVAEYVAGVMLKYSHDNIYDYQQLKREQATKEDPSQGNSQSGNNGGSNQNQGNSGNGSAGNQSGSSQNQGSSGNSGSNQSGTQHYVEDVMGQLAEDLNLNGATIEYASYTMGDTYSTDGILSVPASSDCKVFGFRFLIKNNTSEAVTVNTNSSSVRFKLSVGGRTIAQSATILINDLNSLKNVSIAAGESYESVVIFQVPNEAASNISDMSMSVFSSGVEIGKVPGI